MINNQTLNAKEQGIVTMVDLIEKNVSREQAEIARKSLATSIAALQFPNP